MISGGYEEAMGEEPALIGAARALAAGDDAFGADVFRILAQDSTDTVFSPVSVASALRLALCGAAGTTAAEMASALHLDGSQLAEPADAAADGLRRLAAVLREVTAAGSATFRAPNTVWIQSGLSVRPEFTARLSDTATFGEADFARAPEAARGEINRVIAEQTGGKITGLLPSGSVGAMTRLVLASAVYLKAAWANPFPESGTGDAPFYPDGPDRPARIVPMMRGTASRAYVRGDGYQAVLLPYAGGGLAMAVVLPDGPLASLRATIAADGLGGILAGTARHQVMLSMPRFRLEAAFDLIPVLRRLGIKAAFSDADFSGITGARSLQINAVAHKAYVDVDEHGTEAATATAVGMRAMAAFRSPPPVTMVVDRPFLFAIVHTATSLPLFLGQVSRP
jgi:serpin B